MITTTQITQSNLNSKNPFEQIIEEWENKHILITLTKEERKQEYFIALDKLEDFIKQKMEEEDNELMQEIRRTRIKLSLKSRILTKEEEEEETNDFLEKYEKSTGKKLNRI